MPRRTNDSPTEAPAGATVETSAAAQRAGVGVDAEAERAVISALMSSPVTVLEACEVLAPEDFAVPAAREVFRAARELDAAGMAIDKVTVADQLRKLGQFDRLGGMDLLDAILADAAEVGNVEAHVSIVADKALLRRVLDASRSIAGSVCAPDATGPDALEKAESEVFNLTGPKGVSSLRPMSQAVAETMRELATVRSSLLLGHSTSLGELDRLTAGFQAGQLVTIAARPGVGKSSLMLQMARHIAETTNMVVPFLSYEMSTSELTLRMLASVAGYDLHLLRQGEFRHVEGLERTIAHAGQRLASIPLMLDDTPPETIAGLRAALRRQARRTPIAAVVVDYMQLIAGDKAKGDNRVSEVGEVSRGLKRLASELKVPVITASQLNRSVETRVNKRPQLSDLRESGSIEQDSSLVLMIHRDPAEHGEASNLAEIIIAKQRNGPAGVSVWVEMDAKTGRWLDTDERPEPRVAAVLGGGGRFNPANPF